MRNWSAQGSYRLLCGTSGDAHSIRRHTDMSFVVFHTEGRHDSEKRLAAARNTEFPDGAEIALSGFLLPWDT